MNLEYLSRVHLSIVFHETIMKIFDCAFTGLKTKICKYTFNDMHDLALILRETVKIALRHKNCVMSGRSISDR